MGMVCQLSVRKAQEPCPTWVLLLGALQCLPAAEVSAGIAGEELELPRRELLGIAATLYIHSPSILQ